MKFPINHQQLLELAIQQSRLVNVEFSSEILYDSYRLWEWARKYAIVHDLVAPANPEEYGIYYELDEDERVELEARGVEVPNGDQARNSG